MRRTLWIAVPVLVALLAGAFFYAGARSLDEPLTLVSALRFEVPPGARFARVAADLAARGVVLWPRSWVLYARFTGRASAIKAGEYEIPPGTTPRQLLTKLVNGQVMLHSFTIVDGWRVLDLLDALRRTPELRSTLPARGDPAERSAGIMARLGEPDRDVEGQFLPETYRFVAGTTDMEILRQAHAALERELQADWQNREPDLPLHDAYEMLIMASIIQKESGVPQELAKIAGLYLHRLALGMRLQADPTLIYGMGEHYDGNIRTVDLRTDGPYNTYTRTGLPPTPIALAGAAVLRATAHPEKTDALYFVASPKADGTHVFSATLEQHNIAVAAYLARQRQRAGEPAR